MKVFTILILTLCLLLTGCRQRHANEDMNRYFEREISDRIAVISAQPDSMQLSPVKVDREINNLVLMTKDVENIKITVGLANSYFRSLAVKHHINPADFSKIEPEMDLNEMASLLKQNELDLFNQVIFKLSPSGTLPLYTAH